jgi:NADP-dependent 3-hydroxy acid dehydrogenase YdfG
MNKSRKVVVVTGASQGIGATVAKAFRKRDYRVVATSRSIKQSDDENILSIAGDIGDPTTARRVISEGVARFGRIDTLVNNAGIYIGKPFTEHTAEDYAAVMDVNMAGFYHITQRAIAEMEKHSSGHVVSVTGCDQWGLLGLGGSDEGRHQRCHEVTGDRVREERHPRKCRCAGKHNDADARA